MRASGGPAERHGHCKARSGRRGGGQRAGMSASLSRAAAALLRWGRGAGGGGLPGAGVRAASSGGQAEQLDALVKKDKVVVFLKGTPEQPQCGFSNAVVQILRLHGVRDYAAYNVLDDPELRQGQARGIRRRGCGELERIPRSKGPGCVATWAEGLPRPTSGPRCFWLHRRGVVSIMIPLSRSTGEWLVERWGLTASTLGTL